MATTTTKKNKANLTARNAKITAGIQQHLATMSVLQLAGVSYTPAALTAVFQADSNAIAAAATGHTQWQQAVATQNATIEVAVLGALRASRRRRPRRPRSPRHREDAGTEDDGEAVMARLLAKHSQRRQSA